MKANLYDVKGMKKGDINLPTLFNELVRKTLIQKIVEAKKIQQPYAPNPMAGNSYSASGQLKHHRKVWKSQYGRGMSRVPRKMMTRRGSQFNWVGATVPNTRGGRRAHPPKVLSFLSLARINKKEMLLALRGALAATVNPKWVQKRYATLEDKKIENTAFIVESKLLEVKTKDLLNGIREMLGKDLYPLAIQKKTVRAGIGKLRGRKYKNNLGVLLVIGNQEKLKTTAFDVVKVNKLSVNDLARGGVGRLTIYTENAIKDLEAKFK